MAVRPSGTPFRADGPPTARAEKAGIVLELWLQDTSVHAGDRVFAHVRVTNRGKRAVIRETSPCAITPATVVADLSKTIPHGREWPGNAGEFKRRLLSERRVGLHQFGDARTIDAGPVGCPDIFESGPFRVGQSVEGRLAWDVRGDRETPLLAGQGTAVATFQYWTDRDTLPEAAETVTVRTPITVESGEPAAPLTIIDFVDRALAEPRFAAWLEQAPPSTWINTHVTWWPNEDGEYPDAERYRRATAGAVDITLFRFGPSLEGGGSVTLDVPTGEVLGVRFE